MVVLPIIKSIKNLNTNLLLSKFPKEFNLGFVETITFFSIYADSIGLQITELNCMHMMLANFEGSCCLYQMLWYV